MKNKDRPHFRLPIVLSLISAVLAFVAAGCTQNIDDLRTQGIGEFRNHQYIQSMATLRRALELKPHDAQANYYMGLNYRVIAAEKFREDNIAAACRELDTAIIYFTNTIKTWPNYMEAVASKNEALEARGKYDAALKLAQRVAQNNRGVSDHYIYLGNEYRERGDYDNALRSYKTALAINPESAKAYAAMGKLYLEIGDRALALDSFRRAYELNPYESGVNDHLDTLEAQYKVQEVSLNTQSE
ncbi:MAG: tetratricopeptide repeat protein [Planctomycetota bacterium]|nr:MAG: tetratricopeptide repeat protein [Planctomycetota bacterium]